MIMKEIHKKTEQKRIQRKAGSTAEEEENENMRGKRRRLDGVKSKLTWAGSHKSSRQRKENIQSTSPLGLPAQSPFPFKFLLVFPFLLFLNWSTVSLSTTTSPPPPPSSLVFSPFSFISSRAMLNWARVRTICSIRSGPCAQTHAHFGTQTHKKKKMQGFICLFNHR